MDGPSPGGGATRPASIESKASWRTAWLILAILSVSFGSSLLIVVGMKPIQELLGTDRSVVALAGAFLWVGTGAGGIFMGWLSDRIGVRATVAIGAGMIAAGLVLSSLGWIWSLFVGHALMGLFGNGGVYPPLLVYVSRWFDRRRGTAIALISSGQYVAGVVWPALFERVIASLGWQTLMVGFAVLVLVTILPATLLLKPTPLPLVPQHLPHVTAAGRRIGGMHPNLVQVLLCIAGFCCCIPMSVPQAHLVAFCIDIGISPTPSATMLSVMLAVGLHRPPGVGRAGRSHRRPAHGDGGLGLPGARHLGLFAHPGRGRPVRHLRRLRLRLRRHHPGLLGRHPRHLPAVGGLVAHAVDPVHGHERHGGGKLVRRLALRPLRLLRARPSPPASSSTSSTWRSSASWSCASPADGGSIPMPPSAEDSHMRLLDTSGRSKVALSPRMSGGKGA